MQIIGLTGGIGSGKSTACRILKEIDTQIIIFDADFLSHEAVKPGNLPYFLLERFILPPDCFDPTSGELIRSRLAEMIFSPTPKSRALKVLVERCIHPWVIYKMIIGIIWNWLKGKRRIVLDIPLLFEAKLQWMCTRTILIDVSNSEAQLARIMKRTPLMSESDAKNRMASQFPMEKKRTMADCIIRNDGDYNDLKKQLAKEFKEPNTNTVLLYLIIPVTLTIYIIYYYYI